MDHTLPPASPAEAFLPPAETAAVELPASRGPAGEPLVVHIRRLALVDILRAYETLPVPTGQTAPDGASAAFALPKHEAVMAQVAAAGVTSPAFVFEGDGAPRWADLPFADRSAVFEAIGALAGLSALPPNVRSFRGGPVLERGAG